MRHTGAGLAMPDFRWRSAASLPPVWIAGIAVHFAHRVGALIVLIAVYPIAIRVWRQHVDRMELVLPSLLLVLLVGGQYARRLRRAERAPPAHQHRARRQRRAGARDVSGADAADIPRTDSRSGTRARRQAAGSRADRGPILRSDAVAIAPARGGEQPRGARQAAPQCPRRGVGARGLRDGGRRKWARSLSCCRSLQEPASWQEGPLAFNPDHRAWRGRPDETDASGLCPMDAGAHGSHGARGILSVAGLLILGFGANMLAPAALAALLGYTAVYTP